MTYVIGRTVKEARAAIQDVGFYNCRTLGSAASCEGIGGEYVSICLVGDWFNRRDIREIMKRLDLVRLACPVEFYRGLGHGSSRYSFAQITKLLDTLTDGEPNA